MRERAERIIVALYKDVGQPVKEFLPPDDEKVRRNMLYKLLFEAFDRIDGKPSKDELKVSQCRSFIECYNNKCSLFTINLKNKN